MSRVARPCYSEWLESIGRKCAGAEDAGSLAQLEHSGRATQIEVVGRLRSENDQRSSRLSIIEAVDRATAEVWPKTILSAGFLSERD